MNSNIELTQAQQPEASPEEQPRPEPEYDYVVVGSGAVLVPCQFSESGL